VAAGCLSTARGASSSVVGGNCPTGPPHSEILRLVGPKTVYKPAPVNDVDVLIAAGKVLEINNRTSLSGELVQTLDVTGLVVVPGFVDMHLHLIGGGGESGFASRTPEAELAELVDAGATTVVGVLGTDSVTRRPEDLFAKVRALNLEGLTAYMWTGAYAVPPPTLSGDVRKDIMMVHDVVGVGELAVSDHRSSHPSADELRRICSDARVAGMLSGKAGLCYFHMGSASSGLRPLWEVVNTTALPIGGFLPTHMSRTHQLLREGKQWLRAGGRVDFTSGQNKTYTGILDYWREGLSLSSITCSSDGYGSQPRFDAEGNLVSYGYVLPYTNLELFRALVRDASMPVELALTFFTTNPAEALGLERKGRIKVGADADVLVLDPENDYEVKFLIAKGRILKTPKWTKSSAMRRCEPS